MTPYSLAFTIFRTLAVWMICFGIYNTLDYIYHQTDYRGVLSVVDLQEMYLVIPGALLYGISHWLAKAVVWKIGE
jgi:hypothetical protein